MALIAQTSVFDQAVPTTVARTTLTASDTLTYVPGANQYLMLVNTSGSPITATLTGSAPQPVHFAGYGPVTTSGGKAITVAANATVAVQLDDIALYLAGSGTVTVTGGTGLIAHLMV